MSDKHKGRDSISSLCPETDSSLRLQSVRKKLNDELKRAMREREQITVSTIRLILAAVKEKDIRLRTQGANDKASDQEILSLLQSMIKQREESTKTYLENGRKDLSQREQEEIKVIKRFLPAPLGQDELEAVIKELIEETGSRNIKDMGKVMAELKDRYAGQVDMSAAGSLVKECLSVK